MTADDKELEIKFAGGGAALAALTDSAFMAALTRGEGAWERLETRYFDTPSGELAARGVSLRLRAFGTKRIQTVKRKGADGVIARDEWESVLEPDAPFPALTGACEVDVLLTTLSERLLPTVEMDVDRWACTFPFRRSMLEIAVDMGVSKIARDGAEIEDGEEDAPPSFLGEVELELVSGDAKDLFEAARLVLVNTGLRLHARSKLDAARAAAILGRGTVMPRRAALKFGEDERVEAVLRQALTAIGERMIGIQPAILDARDPAGVHQMRVELRRFRAVERVFRRAMGEDRTLARLAGRAKIIARILGGARDWDVFVGETLPIAARHGYAPEGFAALRARAYGLRADAWRRAAGAVNDPEFSQFLLDLLDAAHTAPWRGGADAHALAQPARAFSRKALQRALRKTRKTARDMDPDSLAARHPLRVALKKQRYAVQLFRSFYPKETRKPYMAAMSALQDAFGVVNDAVVAQSLAEEAAADAGAEAMRAAGFVSGCHSARAEAAVMEIDEAWRRFEAMTPFWRSAGAIDGGTQGEDEC